jgi:serine/threonine-protein kinase
MQPVEELAIVFLCQRRLKNHPFGSFLGEDGGGMAGSRPEHRPTGEKTVDYPPTASLRSDPGRQVTVARLSDGGRLQPGDDIRILLRKRLLFFALLLTALLVMTLVLLATGSLPLDEWAVSVLVAFALGAVFARVLWVGRSLSLRQLRGIELALFGAFYIFWALLLGFAYPTLQLPDPPIWFGIILGYAVCLPWALLILGYGILIPNTWQRCATVVGVLAATPLVISKANGLAAQATAGRWEASFFAVMVVCLVIAAAIAVYGSHRIEVLRRAVAQARRLGQYRLGRQLGCGGMGEVYLAEHLLLRRPCAIKLIRPERYGDPAVLDRFEREVQATATLTHPNTVQVYDYGRAEDGTFYYAMEYLPGVTLEQLVRRYGPLPPARALHFLRQICGALSEAHAVGLVHRDIKPSNIIVCERGGRPDVAKLLDFGLVLARDPRWSAGDLGPDTVIAGTPAYMSPEQAGGRHPLDARTDLYSLGAVAYFLLTGEPPFPRGSVRQMLEAHRSEPAVFPDRLAGALPADVRATVLRCLEKDPAQRFPDAESLERAWAACACAGSWTTAESVQWWQEHDLGRVPEPNQPLHLTGAAS